MRLTVLGCSGGIGAGLRTTSFLVDEDILVDAGTGVGELTLAQLARIDHIFVSHSHLDHICCIPFLADTVGARRSTPITLHALPETIADLKRHVFNGPIWPDFSVLPTPDRPYLRYAPLTLGETVTLGKRRITALPANHVVPAVGYLLQSPRGSLVFSGDTMGSDAFWEAVNALPDLRHLIIETAFAEQEKWLALASRHLCPSLLTTELAKLQSEPTIYITHLKPGEDVQTISEIAALAAAYAPHKLEHGQVLDF